MSAVALNTQCEACALHTPTHTQGQTVLSEIQVRFEANYILYITVFTYKFF